MAVFPFSARRRVTPGPPTTTTTTTTNPNSHMKHIKSTSLHYSEGSSDKEYHAVIQQRDHGYVVIKTSTPNAV